MFVSFGFEFSNFFNSRHRSKVGGNSDSRQGIAIRRSLLQNVNRCEKQQNYYVTSTSRYKSLFCVDFIEFSVLPNLQESLYLFFELTLILPELLPIEIPKVLSQLECAIFAPAERYVYRKKFVISSAPAERYI